MKTRLLRNLSIVLLTVVLVMGSTSCGKDGKHYGKDGKNGKPYIEFEFNERPLSSYSHDIPNVPDTVVEDAYYESEAGEWTFTYVHGDNPSKRWVVEGNLETSSGADGDNLYYELTTFAFLGPILIIYNESSALKIDDVGTCEKKPTQRIVENGWILTINVDCQDL